MKSEVSLSKLQVTITVQNFVAVGQWVSENEDLTLKR